MSYDFLPIIGGPCSEGEMKASSIGTKTSEVTAACDLQRKEFAKRAEEQGSQTLGQPEDSDCVLFFNLSGMDGNPCKSSPMLHGDFADLGA